MRTLATESAGHRLLGLAAEIAFISVLGIFPGLLLAAGLLGALDSLVGADVATGAQQTVVSAMDAVFTDEASAFVASVEGLFDRGSGVLTFATLFALLTISGAFAAVINALNLVHGTVEQRSWIRQRLLGLLMGAATMIVVVIALTVVVVGPFFGRGEDLADLVGLGPAFVFAWDVLRLPELFAGLVLWATTTARATSGWRAERDSASDRPDRPVHHPDGCSVGRVVPDTAPWTRGGQCMCEWAIVASL